MSTYPETFTRTIIRLHGNTGLEWLRNLPALLKACEARWQLRLEPAFSQLTYHYVAPARLPDNTRVVLKLGVPSVELVREKSALELFGGSGCVRLLDADVGKGALLLACVEPGVSLHKRALSEEVMCRTAAELMQRLAQPVREQVDVSVFPTLEAWAQGFARLYERYEGSTGPLDARLVQTAESLFTQLLSDNATDSTRVLLHGDLHHDNILSSTAPDACNGVIAIDPKGVIGPRGYEVATFLRNPFEITQTLQALPALLEYRLAVFSEVMGVPVPDLAAWGFAHVVLSAWWVLEDGGAVSDAAEQLFIAECLQALLP